VKEWKQARRTEDLEYTSKLDAKYRNEGAKITLYQGTNVDSYPIERGNILVAVAGSYNYLNGLNKGTDTTDIPENLLLRAIKSNYGEANIKLTLDLPAMNRLGFLNYERFFKL